VTDLVNLDRVKGLLRTIYWRRQFLQARDERRRAEAAQGGAGGEYELEYELIHSRDTRYRSRTNAVVAPRGER
jgi:hypothetical protein